MWIDFVGSLSDDATPSNISVSSRSTKAARYDSGIGNAASSSPEAPASTVSKISSTPKRYSPVTHRKNVPFTNRRAGRGNSVSGTASEGASAGAHPNVDQWAAVAALLEHQHGV